MQLAQPLADGWLVHRHAEPLGHLALQIDASPAHHSVLLRIGVLDHQLLQLFHLRLVEKRRPARAVTRPGQAGDPFGVVAVHPSRSV
jgi:hypothetical protein